MSVFLCFVSGAHTVPTWPVGVTWTTFVEWVPAPLYATAFQPSSNDPDCTVKAEGEGGLQGADTQLLAFT